MKILLIGSGGREHALAWKLSQSRDVETIYTAPGNAGTDMTNKCCNVQLYSSKEYLSFALDNKIDLTIVGPEKPLVEGVVDLFKKHKLHIFGPSQQGAKLEGSKIFSKDFMKKYGVATATYATFSNYLKALSYLNTIKFPVVIKANGLAAGKGVRICFDLKEATDTINDFMIQNIFKSTDKSIVIEEFLKGVEASIICICDGKNILPFLPGQDHKTIFENNQGPNTGGMGVVCPNPFVTPQVLKDFQQNILIPTLNGIKKEKMDFCGFLFFGIMITTQGCKCLEYNVRMGDPECQSIIPLMNFDLVKLILAAIKHSLNKFKLSWRQGYAVNVVLASKGYPESFTPNMKIDIKGKPLLFFAGTKKENNLLLTNGGRVMSVVGMGKTLKEARNKAYKDIQKVKFDGSYYRKDIGLN